METPNNDACKKRKGILANAQRPRCKVTHLVSCTNTGVQTDTQIHRGMTTLRQATDDYLVALGPLSSDLAEWLQIWAKPLCKSTLKPTSQPPPPHPHCQPLPITALRLTMPSIINIKPSEKQKRSDISQRTGDTSSLEY